jgi:hypothetical protein
MLVQLILAEQADGDSSGDALDWPEGGKSAPCCFAMAAFLVPDLQAEMECAIVSVRRWTRLA